MYLRPQECYDDAMNAADEHGIIHPEACKNPIAPTAKKGVTDTSSKGGERTAAPTNDAGLRKPTTSKPPPAGLATPTPTTENGEVGKQTGPRDGSSLAVGGDVIRPFLLNVFLGLCELARPEIAASTIVAGVCKVRQWRMVQEGEGVQSIFFWVR